MVTALWIMLALAAVVQTGVAGLSGGRETYSDEYLAIQSLPILIIQIFNIFVNLFYVALFGLFVVYARARRLGLIALLTIGASILFLLTTSARTPLYLTFIAAILAWDHLFKRMSVLGIVGLFVLLITAFLALGTVRGGGSSIAAAFAQSEFMAAFVTALDIHQIYVTGSSVGMNFTLLLSDLLRLIPQQVVPFEKVDPASWYVTTFYPQYAASGGGFAFGMLAEAALSGGFFVTILRGLALGSIICIALNFLVRRPSLWHFIIYTWLVASIYQSFRDTTFTLAGRFTFQFLPAILLCVGLSALLRRNDEPTDAGPAQQKRLKGYGFLRNDEPTDAGPAQPVVEH